MKDIKDINEQVEHYAALPYKVIVEYCADQEGYYIARVLELPDLIMTGDTPEEAISDLEKVKRDWIKTYLELGNRMPEPLQLRSHSGNIRVRMEPTLHSALAEMAEVEGISLNQYIATALSRAVGQQEGLLGQSSLASGQDTGVSDRSPEEIIEISTHLCDILKGTPTAVAVNILASVVAANVDMDTIMRTVEEISREMYHAFQKTRPAYAKTRLIGKSSVNDYFDNPLHGRVAVENGVLHFECLNPAMRAVITIKCEDAPGGELAIVPKELWEGLFGKTEMNEKTSNRNESARRS
jgi:predicted HicB family RNase H-like nuclease